MILDGWGSRKEKEGNAILLAKTPHWNSLWEKYPHTFLTTSGESVGLPPNTIGNSEVGHLNIGAGRIVQQDLARINHTIRDKSFFKNEIFLAAMREVKEKRGALHLMGLCSDVGVHAHLDHLDALLQLAKNEGLQNVVIHAITDGRDSSPTSGKGYLERVEKSCREIGVGRIATVSGRYYAMDRDKRWDRTEKTWKAVALSHGEHAVSSIEAMNVAYSQKITDEFILPTVIGETCPIKDGDAVTFFNFRSDRARQITRALALKDFQEFPRLYVPRLSQFVCMTEYDETFGLPIAFPQEHLHGILGEAISEAHFKQLRIAETEKYAHVTFFFNGGREKAFPGEDRCLIPSPRDVPTYDLKPEMNAVEVTTKLLMHLDQRAYDVIILNFANPDMIGHTGNLTAAIKAVETVDSALGKIVPRVLDQGGVLLITSDHGNCEQMIDDKGGVHTAHTLFPVPFLYVASDTSKVQLREQGILADIAPTVLELLEVQKPLQMTGTSLFPTK